MLPPLPGMKIRSPGRACARLATGVPAWTWSPVTLGRFRPAARYAPTTRDEQSHSRALSPECAAVQSPPNEYEVPSCASAHPIAVTTCGGVPGGSLNPGGSATPAPVVPSPPSHTAPPVYAATISVARASCLAYASGNADFCTRCAATVSGSDSHPDTCRNAVYNAADAYAGSMICPGVPQPS